MSYRKQQVESTLKRVVSQILIRRLSDPRITGMVSITRVDVSPDKHNATVYVSVIPEKYQHRSLSGLRHATGHIHSLVKSAVAMRIVPRLRFELDESLKKQADIFEAIDRGLEQDEAAASLRTVTQEQAEETSSTAAPSTPTSPLSTPSRRSRAREE